MDWLNDRKANGIIFTTMQKFEESFECLSERRNIIVMADEAHRGQYGLKEKVDAKTGEIKIGSARIIRNALPNATYIGFTGTPIDATIDVFGGVVDAYTMTESVRDGITVNLVYDGRAAKVNLNQAKVKEIEDYYAK